MKKCVYVWVLPYTQLFGFLGLFFVCFILLEVFVCLFGRGS